MIKVSIVVPVYNVEHFLSRCIQSITNQNYSNIEILLVNDGSTDGSRLICKKFSEQDLRIKLLDKSNGGLSDARNFGIQHATGEFVAFVDSDDWLEPDYIGNMLSACISQNAEVAVCSFRKVYDSERDNEPVELSTERPIITGRLLIKKIICQNDERYVVAWNKLYKKSLFETVCYDKDRFFEDEFISVPLYYAVKKVVVVEKVLYNYFQREGSITHTRLSQKKVKDQFDFYKERIAYFNYRSDDELLKLVRRGFVAWAINIFAYDSGLLDSRLKRSIQTVYRQEYGFKNSSSKVGFLLEDFTGFVSLKVAGLAKKFIKKMLNS